MQSTLINIGEQLGQITVEAKLTRAKPKTPTMTQMVETITPQLALEYLAKNSNNRNIRGHRITEFLLEIKNGTFKFTHQGIAFDYNDNLIDGQHRLHAIVRANVTIKMWVARNADPETHNVIDSGGSRSLGDHLKAIGIKNHNNCAAIARPLTSWVKAQELNRYTMVGVTASAGNRGSATNNECIEFAQAYEPELQAALQAGSYYNRKSNLWTPARINFLYAMYYPCQGKNGGIKEFCDQVFIGLNRDSVRHPASLLHQKLMNNYLLKGKKMGMRDDLLFGYAVEAANLFFANQTRARLSWSIQQNVPQPPVESLQFYSSKVKFAGQHAR